MHIQKHFAESRVPVLHDLIRTWPLATFIMADANGLAVNHMPLMIDADVGEFGLLKGHIPRSNKVWESFDGAQQAVTVFHGPDTYVTPSWYPSKAEHGKVVPTWNYVVAHAHGFPMAIHDTEWLLAHLHAMTDLHEAKQQNPWKISDAPSEYIDMMLRNIVGIEMPIARLDGKWKVSQNRPEADQLAIAAGLRQCGDDNSRAMASLVLGEEN